MTRTSILEAWCYCKTLAGILAFLWLGTFPFPERNSGYWTSNQHKEDLQLQEQLRIRTGFPYTKLRGSLVTKIEGKDMNFF